MRAPINVPITLARPPKRFVPPRMAAVIGGGYTGLTAALRLAELGQSVILLDADEIGQGASGRNKGLVLLHHSKANPARPSRSSAALAASPTTPLC